jgi:hypothetical protein
MEAFFLHELDGRMACARAARTNDSKIESKIGFYWSKASLLLTPVPK